ncbi:5'(3')-nucleotidase/polyphosphatase [Nitratireductor indicus C115]|uniref:5'-nucleotidase SurE n=1 Tax=Nitratireductor indicus C115 TaxID=1231190 RepID=K2PJD7_9HYPH|nr:5'/3'-nucleotidase SurE [Nitratireductor indicus]EKF41272.1 5'(3')-nucleotidase/polyphosphatase [Nitratireductor indicus C115]SFQ65348.1 5'-nucleotidase /3'-nucleotidase /exopolyphosphatase [Nitratireductor indicus]
MRILLSNDDGVEASGLALLEAAARKLSDDVWVIAPDGNRSGFGHGISLRKGFTVSRIGPSRYVCSGTPADCVIAGMNWVFRDDRRPDLVLSGINEGRNVAEDVSYSGTMAVAREASLNGIPAVSFSMPRDAQPMSASGIGWLAERIAGFWEARSDWASDGHWLNVNLPHALPAPLQAARIGRDKVATRVRIHEEDAVRAHIEPLADRNYHALPGDENHLIAAGIASVTRLNWHGNAVVPVGVLHEEGAGAKGVA